MELYCYEAGKRAIGLDLKASGEEHARVEMAKYYGMYEVYYPLDEEPLVSVITTTRAAVEENLKKTKYHNLEVIECGEAYNTENVNAESIASFFQTWKDAKRQTGFGFSYQMQKEEKLELSARNC